MRLVKKQKTIYYAIDKTLIRRHHILRLSAAFLNVFALAIVIAAGFFNSSKPVLAASYTWDGGGTTNNWSDCANWSANICPIAGDTLTFNGTSVKNSVVDAGFSGTITTLTIQSSFTGAVTLDRSLTITSTFTNAGIFNAGSNDLFVAAAFTAGTAFNAGTGKVIFNGAANGTITCNNVVFNRVEFTHTANTKTINSGCTLPLGANPAVTANVTMNGGQLTGTGTITNSGSFTLNNGATHFSGFTGLVVSTLTVTNGATVDFGAYTTLDINASFSVTNVSSFVAPAGEMTVAGATNIATTTGYNANGGTVRFDGGTATIACQPNTFAHAVIAHTSGIKTVQPGCTLPLGANPVISGSSVTVSGTLTGSGLLSHTAGGFTLNNGAILSGFSDLSVLQIAINGTHDLNVFNSISINSALTLNNGAVLTGPATGNISIGTNFIMNTGSTFTAPGGNLSVGGTFTINSGATFNHNNGTIIFNGTANATVSCNNTNFHLVSINKENGSLTVNSNCTLPLGNNPTVGSSSGDATIVNGTLTGAGRLTHFGGTLTLNATGSLLGFDELETIGHITVSGATADFSTYNSFIIGGNYAQTGGTVMVPDNADFNGVFTLNTGSVFTASSDEMSVSGSFTINSGATFNHNNGSILFDGAGAVSLSCGDKVFNHVTIDRTSGTLSIGSNCSLPLGHDPTVAPGGGGTTINLNGTLSGSGLLNSGGILTLSATGSFNGFTGYSPFSLTVNGGSYDFGSANPLKIDNNFTQAGGTFTAPSGDMSVAANFTVTGGNFTHNNGTVILDTSKVATVICSIPVSFNRVVINKSLVADSDIFRVNNGCDLPLGVNPTVNLGAGLFRLEGELSGSGLLTVSGGTFKLYEPTNVLTGFSGLHVNNFQTDDTVTQANFSSYSTFDVDGFFHLQSGSEFIAPSVMSVGLGFSAEAGAVFTHNNGTVVLDGTDQIIRGNITFNNLTKTTVAPAVLTFTAGTTKVIEGTLTLRGGSTSSLLSLVSDTPGTQWSINALGGRNLRYLSVQDSNNTNVSPMVAYDSESLGNNTNWEFLATPAEFIEPTAALANFTLAQASGVAAVISQGQLPAFANFPGSSGLLSQISGLMSKLPGGKGAVETVIRVFTVGGSALLGTGLSAWFIIGKFRSRGQGQL